MIGQRLYLAQRAIELGNAAVWTELSSGVLMTVDPDAPQLTESAHDETRFAHRPQAATPGQPGRAR